MNNTILNNIKNINFVIICVLILFPILPRGIESIFIILLAIHTIGYCLLNKNFNFNNIKWKHFFGLSSIFFILLYSSLYSDNSSNTLEYVIKTIPILVFPFTFIFTNYLPLNNIQRKIILNFYIFSVFLLLLYIDLTSFKEIYLNEISKYNLRLLIQNIVDLNGTYLSMWIGFGIILILNQIHKTYSNRLLLLTYLIVVIYFFYWMININALMPLLGTVISSVFYLLMILKTPKKILLITSVLCLIIGAIFLKDKIKESILSIKNYESAIPKGNYADNWSQITNEDISSGIYHCSLTIIENNKILGVGIGDVDDLLQKCYDTEYNYTDVYKIKNYNSHSQYLLLTLSSGFIGLVFYIMSLAYLIKVDINKKKYLHLSFLILTSMCFCFENILNRHDGVVFFGLFNSLLFFVDFDE